MQIAAIAIHNNLTLVTHNTREVSRISDLKIDDWNEAVKKSEQYLHEDYK